MMMEQSNCETACQSEALVTVARMEEAGPQRRAAGYARIRTLAATRSRASEGLGAKSCLKNARDLHCRLTHHRGSDSGRGSRASNIPVIGMGYLSNGYTEVSTAAALVF
jgi:hypothetical protein